MATKMCGHSPSTQKWIDVEEKPLFRMLGMESGWYPDYDGWYKSIVCEHGNCELDACPVCGHIRGGVGPVGCPCDEYPPDPFQRPRPRSFGMKPSLAKRHSGKHRVRRRKGK